MTTARRSPRSPAAHVVACSFTLVILTACGHGREAPSWEWRAAPVSGGDAGSGTASGASEELPYDALFLDAMADHQDAVARLAREAADGIERAPIRDAAITIAAAREGEAATLRTWRAEWYPDLPPTGDQGATAGPSRPTARALPMAATDADAAFVAAMCEHLERGVVMAEDGSRRAEHAELRAMAARMASSHRHEVERLRELEDGPSALRRSPRPLGDPLWT